MQMIPMTKSGKEKLEEQLDRLKRIERPQITKDIASARELGDLKENAEYHAAREKQGITEAVIRDIEDKLSRSQVIDLSKIPNTGKVVFGSYIAIENMENGKETKYQIVGEDESDLENSKISVTSPLARSLIGKEEGDIAEVKTPDGILEYEITSVSYTGK
ncbi:MAG: transcription elongation factor GreA [Legionellales bacterium]|jgi:transcription elongation factor GreA|nr:transcription elongation factor GreA [Legionellales bacterium]